MRITVIGTGYLGATHAACMAELGYEVLGLDIDPSRVASLSEGLLPFHEPGLPELLRKHVNSGRLRFTTSYEEVGAWGDVHFIGVGTPQRTGEGAADMQFVDAATISLARNITKDSLIVGKSTVPVGTTRRLKTLVRDNKRPGVSVSLAWNPEFLREGFAVVDTLTPDRLVIGVESREDEEILREVYATAIASGVPLIATDFETAELVKVAANAFLATKISFINAFSEVTEVIGGDIRTLADAIGLDARIGRRFLNAGIGFGGGCLPKDIRALQARTVELGLERSMRFLDEMDEINLRRRERAVHLARLMLGSLSQSRIAILGVAFKPNSDDVRDSPALDVAGKLFDEGAEVLVYDPAGNANASRRSPQLTYVTSMVDAVKNADLVLLLTEWDEFKALTPEVLSAHTETRRIIDGRNILDAARWEDAGWSVGSLGRRFPVSEETGRPASTALQLSLGPAAGG
ncbi:UDPglucose 6-dehydrogenase [Arthrobacter sp. yr096]|uniref:UDP-glucose dehydrogenase family protein n=1 Tax=unclassified Arthrobacter TaxID=235627 RepID=UPI0008992A21|nr:MULTISPECIES: UDP-glucose/GDP-mannose dehydrogenase family protein [unclassified Arthrobacter]SDX02323.1 UDPglucose 6-dehydrogenase [Arthrobacter sp. cf158]SEJ17321.1 UDPglucose 6-dehydrogenase [Arthrobacter sp. yr096]